MVSESILKMKNQTQTCKAFLCVLFFFLSVTNLTEAYKNLPGSFKIRAARGEDFLSYFSRNKIRTTQAQNNWKENAADFVASNAAVDGAFANASKDCNLTKSLLERMYSNKSSQWIVDNRSLFMMGNDLQLLIQCTRPGDVIVFATLSVVGPIRPLIISHNLTIVGRNNHVPKRVSLQKPLITFSCPYNNHLMLVTSTGHLTLINIKVTGCEPFSGLAIIHAASNATCEVHHVVFENNDFRAVYALSNTTVRIDRCAFLKTSGKLNGGVIAIESGASLKVTGSIFRENEASGNGGCIYAAIAAAVSISSSEFSGNSATNRGGSIYFNTDSSASIWNSEFLGNIASYDGGALYFYQGNRINVAKSTFIGNTAGGSYSGGAVYIGTKDQAAISASTFIGNFAKYGGAMRFIAPGNTTIVGCKFIGNRASSACPDVHPDPCSD